MHGGLECSLHIHVPQCQKKWVDFQKDRDPDMVRQHTREGAPLSTHTRCDYHRRRSEIRSERWFKGGDSRLSFLACVFLVLTAYGVRSQNLWVVGAHQRQALPDAPMAMDQLVDSGVVPKTLEERIEFNNTYVLPKYFDIAACSPTSPSPKPRSACICLRFEGVWSPVSCSEHGGGSSACRAPFRRLWIQQRRFLPTGEPTPLKRRVEKRRRTAGCGLYYSMLEEYNTNVMMRCKVCARTFYEDAYRKHVKGCSQAKPFPKRG